MAYADALSNLAGATLALMGGACTVDGAAGTGVLDHASHVEWGEAGAAAYAESLVVSAADFPAVRSGSSAVVGAQTYSVVAVEDEAAGLHKRLILKRA